MRVTVRVTVSVSVQGGGGNRGVAFQVRVCDSAWGVRKAFQVCMKLVCAHDSACGQCRGVG